MEEKIAFRTNKENKVNLVTFRVDTLQKKFWVEELEALGVKDFSSYARQAIDRSIALDQRSKNPKWQEFLFKVQGIAKEVLGYRLVDNLEHLEKLSEMNALLTKQGEEIAIKKGIENVADMNGLVTVPEKKEVSVSLEGARRRVLPGKRIVFNRSTLRRSIHGKNLHQKHT